MPRRSLVGADWPATRDHGWNPDGLPVRGARQQEHADTHDSTTSEDNYERFQLHTCPIVRLTILADAAPCLHAYVRNMSWKGQVACAVAHFLRTKTDPRNVHRVPEVAFWEVTFSVGGTLPLRKRHIASQSCTCIAPSVYLQQPLKRRRLSLMNRSLLKSIMNTNGRPSDRTPAAEYTIDSPFVAGLLAEQHPDLAHLPLVAVDAGWDNAMYRLGDYLAVRLPRRSVAAPLIVHEQNWLPLLADGLTLPVPVPYRTGTSTGSYPWRWSVVPWLRGVCADQDEPVPSEAPALAAFLRSLHTPAPLQCTCQPGTRRASSATRRFG